MIPLALADEAINLAMQTCKRLRCTRAVKALAQVPHLDSRRAASRAADIAAQAAFLTASRADAPVNPTAHAACYTAAEIADAVARDDERELARVTAAFTGTRGSR